MMFQIVKRFLTKETPHEGNNVIGRTSGKPQNVVCRNLRSRGDQ